MNITALTFDTLDSTNTEALKQARLGADEGLCIVARQQTAGRGRHGRKWVSEKDAGLYFSIVLRPKLETKHLPLITLMSGIAVHDTLVELNLKPDIKWVNDILVNEKKISGILAETAETDKGLAVIVGVGITIKSSNFSPEIANIATSIEQEISQQPAPAATEPLSEPGAIATGVFGERLATALTDNLIRLYSILNGKNGPERIIEQWRKRSTYFSGKSVRVVVENEAVIGTTDGLEENGALRIRQEDGTVAIIQAGDVERLRVEK